jgi:hypothetical protein
VAGPHGKHATGRSPSRVRRLVREIYRDRAFERMPELAGVLERAGCPSRDLIDHCRMPGEHFLGCWALDLLLGKR